MSRRHLTTAVTLLVLGGILATGLVVGMKSLLAPLPSVSDAATTPPPGCATELVKRGQRLRSNQVVVSVYNGGTRAGLAGKTLDRLVGRGFQAGEVGNAPAKATPKFVQVWTTEKHDAAARLVALQFGPRTVVRVTKYDLSDGVDVVLGNGFRGLVKARHSIRVHTGQQLCS